MREKIKLLKYHTNVFSYDINTDTWTQLGDRPAELDSAILHSYYDSSENVGVIFQCSGSRGSNPEDSVFHYTYDNDSWYQAADCPDDIETLRGNSYYYDTARGVGVVLCFDTSGSEKIIGTCLYEPRNESWQFRSSSLPMINSVDEIDMFFGSYIHEMGYLIIGNGAEVIYSIDNYGHATFVGKTHSNLSNNWGNDGIWLEHHWIFDSRSNLAIVFEEGYNYTGRSVFAFNPIPLEIVEENDLRINAISVPNRAFVGEKVNFISSTSDPNNEISEYTWESDIDGVLSYSKNFNSSSLSLGNHNITFWFQDKDDKIYLVKITGTNKNSFNKTDEKYLKFVNNQNTNNRKSILQSYDQLLNDKYQVQLNQKTIDRVKNYFK